MKTAQEVLAMCEDAETSMKDIRAACVDVFGEGYNVTTRSATKDALIERIEKEQSQAAAPVKEADFREVILVRKYAPKGHYKIEEDGMLENFSQLSEGVLRNVSAGTTIHLPKMEAQRAVKLKIAAITEASFG
jgi:hypothetical protein